MYAVDGTVQLLSHNPVTNVHSNELDFKKIINLYNSKGLRPF